MYTILLLTISNIFMTIAWYGHLKYKDSPLRIVILASWGDCLPRILFPRAGKSDWTLLVQRRAIENHPGSDYPSRVLRLFGCLFEGRTEMELSGRLCHDDWGGSKLPILLARGTRTI